MRFRTNIEHVGTFQRIIQSIEKLQKRCIIKFTEAEMRIICNEETEDGVQVWSQIKIDSLFSDYRIQSNANNEINILLSPEALLQALKSAQSGSEVVMRLAKKHGHAVLAFDITLALGGGGLNVFANGRRAQLAHDVLIDVLRPADMVKLREPLCPEPDMHVLLPPLQKLRTVAEHMRAMSDVISIHASGAGVVRLSVESDQARVETQWTKCTIPIMQSQGQESQEEREVPDPERLFGVRLSIRAFLRFLSSHVVSTSTIACLCENYCLILYVYIGEGDDTGGVLTFYIPARLSGMD